MATSPLQAALKPVGATESPSADEAYSTAMQQLMSTLEARQNRGSGNTLLAIAEGLLSPTPTGSFGEGLGQAAKAVRGVQAQQEKEQMDLAQMRLQLAQAQREQAMKQKGLEMLDSRVQDNQESGPTLNVRGQPMSPAKIAAIKYRNKELGEALETEYKLMLDSVSVQPGGFANKLAKEYTPFGGKTTVERFVPGDPKAGRQAMTVPMSEADAIEFDQARTKGDAKTYWDVVKRNTTSLPEPTQEALQATAELVKGTKIAQTPAELKRQQDIQEERNKTLAREGAKSEQNRTDEVMASGKSAKALLPIYDRTEKLLKEPGMDQVMGVLKRGDVLSGIGNLLNESLRVGNFSVGVPAIKQILTESGVDQRIIDRASEVGQLLAITQFEQRKGLGSGTSVSNFEQQMVNAMGPNLDDTLRTFNQKLKFLKEKSNFESSLSSALRKSKLTYDEFEDTKEFQRMFDSYREKQMNIAYPTGIPKGAAPSTGPITSGFLRERLGIK